MKDKEDIKKWTKIILIAMIGYLVVTNISVIGGFIGKIFNILTPFIFGACVAFVLNLPMSFFEKKLSKIKNKKGKTLNKNIIRFVSLILAIVVILGILSLIINLIVPEIINIIKLLIDKMPYYGEKIKVFAEDITQDLPDINSIVKSINFDNKEFQTQIKNIVTNFFTISISVAGNVAGLITNLVIGIVFSIYILTSKEKLAEQAKKILYAYLSKEKANKIIELGRTSRNIFKKFITGQCLEATILGSLSIIGMLILKVPYAVPIGVLIGVTALIPIVGAFIGIIIGAILILSVNPIKVITFIVFILILQQIEGNLIYPKVVGDSVGLPGIWVLVAVTVGGNLFGILGMLLGLPIASIFYTILKEDVYKKLK